METNADLCVHVDSDNPVFEVRIERVEISNEKNAKGKTLGCWGPSPDDDMNLC